MVTQHIVLDMTPGTKPIVNVSQYDTGARTIVFHLRQNRQTFTPPEGCTAIIHGIKPDSTYFSYAAEIDGDTVVADCTEQMTACVGFAECEIRLSNTEGHVGSANFLLNCEKSPMTGAVISESVIAAAEQLTDRAEQAASSATASATAASESAEQAGESATNAGESADRAAREAEAASQAAEEAGESATAAAESASSASDSEASARQYSAAAEGFAVEASESAQGATQASQTASAKAEEAAQSAELASGEAGLAEGYARDAQLSAQSAQQNAQAAEGSANNAAGSASTATTAAGTATQKAGEASQSASAASTSASQAAESATAANTSAEQAADSVLAASGSAETASQKATEAGQNATNAANSASAAAASEANASASAQEAAAVYEDLRNNTIVGLYGARWDRLTNHLNRLAMAEGITTDTTNFGHFGSINANYSNPFDDIYPWSEMVVCDVDLDKYRTGTYSLKECITAVYGDPDFTYEPSQTNFVGRYRPEFWGANIEDSDGNVSYYVSQIERPGFKHYEEAIDGISFCVDVGGNHVSSGAGVPLANVVCSTIHARAKADGFTLQDIYSVDAQTLLYLVEYANWNSQQAIGDGCSSCYRQNDADVVANVATADGKTSFTVEDSALSSLIYAGAQLSFGAEVGATTYKANVAAFAVSGSVYSITLDREIAISNGMIMSVHGFSACEFPLIGESLGNASGYLGTAQKANAWYRGCVMYANRYQYILGIYRQTGTNHLWVCPDSADPNDYDALNTSVHEDTGIALPILKTAAWETVGGNAQVIPGLNAYMATGVTSGSSTTPVGDQQYVPLPSTSNTVLFAGCHANHGWSCGVLGGAWNRGAGNSNWYDAARPLLKNPL